LSTQSKFHLSLSLCLLFPRASPSSPSLFLLFEVFSIGIFVDTYNQEPPSHKSILLIFAQRPSISFSPILKQKMVVSLSPSHGSTAFQHSFLRSGCFSLQSNMRLIPRAPSRKQSLVASKNLPFAKRFQSIADPLSVSVGCPPSFFRIFPSPFSKTVPKFFYTSEILRYGGDLRLFYRLFALMGSSCCVLSFAELPVPGFHLPSPFERGPAELRG